jgi:hypothetical protein
MEQGEDLALMESTLLALGDVDIRGELFDRFFEAFPEQRPAFTNLEAASRRMTNETIEAMLGLAEGARWVDVTVADFIDLHRRYAPIPAQQYEAFVDMVIAELAASAGSAWTPAAHEVWHRRAGELKAKLSAEHARQIIVSHI